jgi:hypothetical protein
MAEYGRITSMTMIEEAVAATVRTWLSDYLGEALAQAGAFRATLGLEAWGRHDLPDPTDLDFQSELDWPDQDQEVALAVIVSPGTVGEPAREAAHYSIVWDVRAIVLTALPDPQENRRAGQMYAAAMGKALGDKGVPLPGATVHFRGEGARVLRQRGKRTLVGGEARFYVMVENARAIGGGPEQPSPPEDPRQVPDPAKGVLSTDIDLRKIPVDG